MVDPLEIKLILKSSVTANPMRMTVRELEQDFRKCEGYSIPYKDLGFTDLESYLRSIPDALVVVGSGLNAEVRVVVGEKSAHIVNMIARQKSSSSKHGVGRAKRIPFNSNLNHQSSNIEQPQNQARSPKSITPNFNYQQEPTNYARKKNPRSNFHSQHNTFSFQNTQFATQNPLSFPQNNYHLQNSIYALPVNPFFYTSRPIKNPVVNSPDWKNLKNNCQPKCPKNNFPKYTNYDNNHMDSQEQIKKDLKLLPDSAQKNRKDYHRFSNGGRNNSKPEVAEFEKKETVNDQRKSGAIPKIPSDMVNGNAREEINYKVPMFLQKNLKKLIVEHPEGIWCSELPTLYNEMFGAELKYTSYGYKSLIQMCSSLDYIFQHKLANKGDFKLYFKDSPIPESDYELFTDIPSPKEPEIATQNTQLSALPKTNELIHLSSFMYPADVVMKGTVIPRQKLEAAVGDYVDIRVAEIYDPSKFWFSLESHEWKLNKLMDDIQVFYKVHHKQYAIPNIMIQENLYCVSIYMNEYHRGIICNILPSTPSKVKVFFIDYGTVGVVKTDNLFFLHTDFISLPQQAIRGRLARIYPPFSKTQWSLESSDRFLALVSQKALVAQIDRIDEQRCAYEMLVADTSGEKDIFINDSLVFEGHAIFTHQDQQEPDLKPEEIPLVKYLHLFPTFEEIELGLVASAYEMLTLQPLGIPIVSLYPQYFKKVEAPKETAPPPGFTNFTKNLNSLPNNEKQFLNENVQNFFKQEFQQLCVKERKVVIEQEILNKPVHIISYNKLPYVGVEEIQKTFLSKIEPILSLRRKFAFGHFITLENINLKCHSYIKENLLRFNLVDEKTDVLDIILLKYLPDFLEELSGVAMDIGNMQELLSLYDYFSIVWQL